MSIVSFAQAKVPTTTALTITANGSEVTTVPAGAVVTLTASVTPATGKLSAGQVKFCDSSSNYCTDVHLLGIAQVTSAGTATFKIRPGIGSHNYQAIFLGTASVAGSSSSKLQLTATGTIPKLSSTTTINETGGWGAYNLSATVTETGNTAPPTGTVSFVDTNHSNAVLGTGTLGASTQSVAWTTLSTVTSVAGVTYAAADLNNDGIPDLFVADYFGTYDTLLGKGDGTFTVAASTFGPNSASKAFAVGDFNNDGIPDVAAICSPIGGSTLSVTVFLGKGDGTFTVAAASPALGSSPTAIATGDFNGDGNADLVIAQSDASGNGQLLLFSGNGEGTFVQLPDVTSVPAGAASIFPADLNNDGKMDLLIAGVSSAGNIILLGHGDGSFDVHSGVGQSAGSVVAIADLNNDGVLDLLFPNSAGGSTANDLTVYLGVGDGTFTPAPSSPDTNVKLGNGFVIADFNHDGVPDLVYASPYPNTIASVLLGNGDGTFVEQANQISFPYDFDGTLLVADFNGDGWPDVLTEDTNQRAFLTSLTAPTETAVATSAVSIPLAGSHLVNAGYAGDAHYSSSGSGTIPLWGNPPGTSTALALTAGSTPVTSVAPGTAVTLTTTVAVGGTPITAGQINFCDASAAYCTGIHLLATASLTSNGTASFKFVPGTGAHSYKAIFVESGLGLSSTSNSVSLNVGAAPAPTYSDTTTLTFSGYPAPFSLTATMIGYGGSAIPSGNVSFVDTSFGNNSLGSAPLGTATPGLGWNVSQMPSLSNPPLAEVAGDFNGDGIPDIAVLWTSSAYGGGPFSVTLLLGSSTGSFTTGSTTALTGIQDTPAMFAGDFTGDGKSDLAVLYAAPDYSKTYVMVLPGNGDGTFAASKTSLAYNGGNSGGDVVQGCITAGDFNGDGKMDLAVVGSVVASGNITILLGNGDGTFAASGMSYGNNSSFSTIASGDFNRDGIPDLVVNNFFSPGEAFVLLGKGDGTFVGMPTPIPADNFSRALVVSDFNGDGILDLAFGYNTGAGIFLGKGDGTFQQVSASPSTGSGLSLVAGDFNHDGKADLAGVDNYYDQIDIFLGKGDGTFTELVTTPNVGGSPLGPFAIVAADFNGDGVPDLSLLTKSVDFGSLLVTVPTQTVSATVNDVALVGPGTHNVQANYAGDVHYPASVSNIVSIQAGLEPLVITPASGSYSTVQTVTITEAIPGATIYYAGYGVMNTIGFVPYTGPITLPYGGTETIYAYAEETGYSSAQQTSVTYYLNFPQATAPVISPAAGYYAGPQTATITDSDTTAKIYYTTNGVLPTLNSTLYTGPITVSASETIVARAFSSGHSASNPSSAAYVIGSSSLPLIYSVAGTGVPGYSGDGGLATLAQIGYFDSVVKDAAGNLYVSDAENHMVRKVAAGTGIITAIAGDGAIGYSGDGGPGTSAELSYPSVLALDGSGNLFIGDSEIGVVRKLNLATGIITTYAGDPGVTSPGDGGPANLASLGSIYGLAVDASQNLYISGGNSIRVVNNSTGIISALTPENGPSGFAGDGGPVKSATFGVIQKIAFDTAGNLFVPDSVNDVIRMIAAVNGVISPDSIVSTVAGTQPISGISSPGYSGDGGPATSAKLYGPVAVAVDKSGNLYIADADNNVIREVAASSGIISTLAGNGVCGTFYGDATAASASSLCVPVAVALDSSGNIYISDESNRIREVIPSTPPSTQTKPPHFSVTGGSYATPQTITITDDTPGASIYVTVDGSAPTTASAGYGQPITVSGSVTVKAVAAAPGYNTSATTSATYNISAPAPLISTFAGNGVSGFSGTGGPAANVEFGLPSGLAFDHAGNLYVADENNNVIWKIAATSGLTTVFAGTGTRGYTGDGGQALSATFDYPMGLAVDSAGNLYVADSANSAIRKISASTGVITTYAGGLVSYLPNLGDGGPAASAFINYPQALAFDAADNLYIADTNDNRIRKVTATSGIITTVAGGGTSVSGGDGGPATSAGLSSPNSVAIARNGDIYVGSSYSGKLRKVTAATGIITTIAGVKDLEGQTGDGGAATQAEVWVSALTLDSSGNLYVGNFPGTIRKIDGTTGVISRFAGIGFPGDSGDGGAAADAQIFEPYQLAFDALGNLYFCDYSSRVRKITLNTQAVATPVFSPAAGSYSSPQNVTISESTPGAAIYYTTDGSTPTSNSTKYANPISVASSETLKAVASAPGYSLSAVASASYVITGTVAPTITWPTPSPITYGTPLSNTQLNATASVAGTFVYSPPSGTVLNAGQQSLTATFTPSNSSAYSTASKTVSLTVNPITPTLNAVSSSLNPSLVADSVTFTATATSALGVPSGTITFMDGSTSLGAQTLTGGSATFATSALSAGSHSITAVYSGSGNFAPVTSAPLTQVVESFSIGPATAGSSSATVSAGGQATFALVATPPSVGSALTFQVAGLPAGATATFAPQSVNAGAGPTNVTLTINVPTTSAMRRSGGSLDRSGFPILIGIFLLPGLRRYRTASRRWRLFVLPWLIIAMISISACGGGATGGKPISNPPKTYSLTVTATSGSLTESTKLTLIVD